uniref:Uncharacterized protein n=1 Tax=Anopheles quadriannulatus TaxID=34691 RepID=A0A182XR39_ANOQN
RNASVPRYRSACKAPRTAAPGCSWWCCRFRHRFRCAPRWWRGRCYRNPAAAGSDGGPSNEYHLTDPNFVAPARRTAQVHHTTYQAVVAESHRTRWWAYRRDGGGHRMRWWDVLGTLNDAHRAGATSLADQHQHFLQFPLVVDYVPPTGHRTLPRSVAPLAFPPHPHPQLLLPQLPHPQLPH